MRIAALASAAARLVVPTLLIVLRPVVGAVVAPLVAALLAAVILIAVLLVVAALLLAIALLLLVALYVFRPLLLPVVRRRSAAPKADLERQKEALLLQIKRLDLDFETNVLPEEAYRAERRQLLQMAADTLRRIEQQGDGDDVDAQIERAVSRLRQPAAQPDAPDTNNFCPQCGRSVEGADRFCRSCGANLVVAHE